MITFSPADPSRDTRHVEDNTATTTREKIKYNLSTQVEQNNSIGVEKQSQDENFDTYFAAVEGKMIANQEIEEITVSDSRSKLPNGSSV